MKNEQGTADVKSATSDIIERLGRGEFPNEAAVSTGVVARLLSALGWEIFNPVVVAPQYSTDSGRVDYALCHPPKKPYIFVEVKAVGKARDGESQAFRYAFDEGVAILVVTDGKEWFLYLPTGQGKHSDRQFYALDLLERPLDVCVEYYSDHESDLGNFSAYPDFLKALGGVMEKCHSALAGGRYCTVIMSDFTVNKKETCVQADMVGMMQKAGFEFRGTTVLLQNNKPLYPFGYPHAYVINHHHQNIMNFRKR